MLALFTRACPLVLATTLAALGGDPVPPKMEPPVPPPWLAAKPQPKGLGPEIQPPYTAFPDLEAPTYEKVEVKGPGETPVEKFVVKNPVTIPALPVVAADAPPLRKVQLELLREGLVSLARMKEVFEDGRSRPQDLRKLTRLIGDAYLVAAELEEKPARRVAWHEARVRKYKHDERFVFGQVFNGISPRDQLCQVRFERLRTEADLLELQARLGPAKGDRPAVERNPEPGAGDIKERPGYTAFPELKAPTVEYKEVKGPDGAPVKVNEEKDLIVLPALPKVAADAPPLRKVRLEQIREGLNYLDRVTSLIRIGAWGRRSFDSLDECVAFCAEVYLAAADLEEEPARRMRWYEARVRKLKEIEQFTELRVRKKTDPPQYLYLVRFQRLRAEADLLRLKATLGPRPKDGEPAAKPKPDPVAKEPPDRPSYTAFPGLKPEIPDPKDVKGPEEPVRTLTLREVAAECLPPLAADAPPLRRVRYERALEGMEYLVRVREVIRLGAWTDSYFFDYLTMSVEVSRAAADLEEDPAKRVKWYEGRVLQLKLVERFTWVRVQNGVDPPQNLNQARFYRLRTEAELLLLKAEVERSGKK